MPTAWVRAQRQVPRRVPWSEPAHTRTRVPARARGSATCSSSVSSAESWGLHALLHDACQAPPSSFVARTHAVMHRGSLRSTKPRRIDAPRPHCSGAPHDAASSAHPRTRRSQCRAGVVRRRLFGVFVFHDLRHRLDAAQSPPVEVFAELGSEAVSYTHL